VVRRIHDFLLAILRNKRVQRFLVLVLLKPLMTIFTMLAYLPMKLFPINNRRLLFMSFQGRGYNCNPRYIFEGVCDEFGDDYEYVWVINNARLIPEDYRKKVKTVKYGSFTFFYYLATSKYWVMNTHFLPEIKPRKGQVYLQTWHAAGAFKKFGLHNPVYDESVKKRYVKDASHFTYLLCSSGEVKSIFASALELDEEKIVVTGLPRNDILFKNEKTRCEHIKKCLREEYGVDTTCKIILYAPTFRDLKNEDHLHLDVSLMREKLKNRFVLFIRFHPGLSSNIGCVLEREHRGFCYNLSAYPDVQELLLITDILVTDYSSVIFDFAILGRPILFYPYDLQEYERSIRGFYWDYETFVPGPICFSTDELIDRILTVERWHDPEKIVSFAKRFNTPFDGNATRRVMELLGFRKHY